MVTAFAENSFLGTGALLLNGTNPITGKGVSYSILERFWVIWYINVACILAA